MDEKKIKEKIKQLTKSINHYNKTFFQEAKSLISDFEYDQLLVELTKLERQYPQYKQKNSPTQKIGEAPSKNFPPAHHKYRMYSLGNTYQKEEIQQFITRINKRIPQPQFVCELKIDGIALNIIYQQGKIKKIITRGDGIRGDDITANLALIKYIPQEIKNPDAEYLEIRGEAFMPQKNFDIINQHHKKIGKEPLANPRNATAGLLRTKQTPKWLTQKQPLAFSPYSLSAEHITATSQKQVLNTFSSWGFQLFSQYQHCKNIDEITQYIDHWKQEKKNLPMMIDGIVIKVNNLQQQQQLGYTNKNPRWAVAYKYPPDHTTTTLKNITFQVGRTGVITPVAEFTPVQLAGTIIKRASLYNAQEIKRLNLYTGDEITIEKGGDIIPKVTKVNARKNTTKQAITFPTHCPSCKTKLIQSTQETLHYCPNHSSCTAQQKEQIAHFVQRKAMNITSIGKKTINLLFQNNLIKQPIDLFYLKYKDLAKLQGFQEKSIQNLLQALENAKKQPFRNLLFALGIRHVGSTVAKKITESLQNINQIISASKDKLTKIPEVGARIAESIIEYFLKPENKQQIEKFRQLGFSLSAKQDKTERQLPLANKTFVVSGIFENYSRERIKSLIESEGGHISTSPSRQTHFLIAGKNPGPKKLAQARKLNIPIITEKEFEEMIPINT